MLTWIAQLWETCQFFVSCSKTPVADLEHVAGGAVVVQVVFVKRPNTWP